MQRILIVDDSIDLTRQLHEALRTAHPDIPVTVVPSAEEALLEATSLAFDLLVTDLRLPGITGIDLIRKIRARQPHIKVILMTALRPDDGLVRQKDQVAPDLFLRKPQAPAAFVAAVDSLLVAPVQAEISVVAAPLLIEPEPAALVDELSGVLPGEPVLPGSASEGTRRKEDLEETVTASLSTILSHLRVSVSAQAVLLLDDRGHAPAQAGDLPGFSSDWALIPPLMTSLSAVAKISYLLGQPTPQAVQIFRGKEIDLVVSPVGQYSLLVVWKSGCSALRLALALEELAGARTETAAVLEAMGLHVMTGREVGAPEQLLEPVPDAVVVEPIVPQAAPLREDPSLEKFEDLFVKKQTGALRLLDADSFWETASEESGPVEIPGVLSFTQAQRLGLFPPVETDA